MQMMEKKVLFRVKKNIFDFDDALEKMNDHVCGILRIILSGQHKKSMTSK